MNRLLVALVVLCVSITLADGLKCYICTGYSGIYSGILPGATNKACTDEEWDPSAIKTIDSPDSYYCTKLDGNGIYTRASMPTYINMPYTHFCNTDYCNAAAGVTASMATLVAAVVAVIMY